MIYSVRNSKSLKKSVDGIEVEFPTDEFFKLSKGKREQVTQYLRYAGFRWYRSLGYWAALAMGRDAGDVEIEIKAVLAA